jgi:hypothetical protein
LRRDRPRRRAAEQRDELASPHGRLGPHISTPLCKNVAVHHSKNCALMSQMDQKMTSDYLSGARDFDSLKSD